MPDQPRCWAIRSTEATESGYLEKTCAKLRVRTRIEAVAVAVRDGIIDPDAE